MGNTESYPVLDEHTAMIMALYNIKPRHISRLHRRFVQFQNETFTWTINEFNKALPNYPDSFVTPCLKALVDFGSASQDGRLRFVDFLVSVCSFCALSKEELLQFSYIIIDVDRSAVLDMDELTNFFNASCKMNPKNNRMKPYKQMFFPMNYMDALAQFQNGEWESLVFEEFCLMCDLFPHMGFPAVRLQDMLRRRFLGSKFWREWDKERLKIFHLESESKTITFTGTSLITGEEIKIIKPGRVGIKEIFEFTKRNGLKRTANDDQDGRKSSARSGAADSSGSTSFTKARDEVITRAPLLNMIRNPDSVYHVPLEKHVTQAPVIMRQTGNKLIGAIDKIISA